MFRHILSTVAMIGICQSFVGCKRTPGISPASGAPTVGRISCPNLRIPVRRAVDSIPEERSCEYVAGALMALASAQREEVVLASSDTGLVSGATVDAIAETDSLGNTVAAWWLVTLSLDRRSYNAEVRFNQGTGERLIRPIHK
jgi:hypothetical protein